MSTIASWSYRSVATFWSRTEDEYGQPVWSRQYALPCAFEQGGDLAPAPDGSQFQPKHRFWFEYLGANPPAVGWQVALGDHAGLPPATAEEIRSVTQWDMAMFGEPVNDWTVATGG